MAKIELVACSMCKPGSVETHESDHRKGSYTFCHHCGMRTGYMRIAESRLAWNAFHAPRQEWVLCKDRMPKRKDANGQGQVLWVCSFTDDPECAPTYRKPWNWAPNKDLKQAWWISLPSKEP